MNDEISKSTETNGVSNLAPLEFTKLRPQLLFQKFLAQKAVGQLEELKKSPDYLKLEGKVLTLNNQSENLEKKSAESAVIQAELQLLKTQQIKFLHEHLSAENRLVLKLPFGGEFSRRLQNDILEQQQYLNITLMYRELHHLENNLKRTKDPESVLKNLNQVIDLATSSPLLEEKHNLIESIKLQIVRTVLSADLPPETRKRLVDNLIKTLPYSSKGALTAKLVLNLSGASQEVLSASVGEESALEGVKKYLGAAKQNYYQLQTLLSTESEKIILKDFELNITRIDTFINIKERNAGGVSELARRNLLRTFDTQGGFTYLELSKDEHGI